MQWLHASFGIGITSGPLIMTLAISLTSKWQLGFFFTSFAIGLLAIIFFITKNFWNDITFKENKMCFDEKGASIIETLKKIPVLLSMLLFFLYTGVELGIGHWIY